MGERIVSENPRVQTVKYTLPNKHYIPVDMRYAGIDNLTPCVISPLVPFSLFSLFSLLAFHFLSISLCVLRAYAVHPSCARSLACLASWVFPHSRRRSFSASRVPPIAHLDHIWHALAISPSLSLSAICNLPDPSPAPFLFQLPLSLAASSHPLLLAASRSIAVAAHWVPVHGPGVVIVYRLSSIGTTGTHASGPLFGAVPRASCA